MRILVLLLAFLALVCGPASAATTLPDSQKEYIILTGGVSMWQWEKYKAAPHDNWWMNFVRASRIRIQQIQAENPNAQITWLVYRPSYVARAKQEKNDLISHIESVRDAFHVKLIFFDKTEELINYLNYGQNRDQVKIANFEFFGHSNRACWMFDYSNNLDSASKCWLHEDDLKQIRRGIFTKDAFVKSWSCHTGEEMSKKWKSATGIPMIGAIGKTQYMTDELPILSSENGKWVK
jgi:hypothetical protein